MILSMPGQAWLFVATVGTGAAAGVFFDFFRVLRRAWWHPRWLVHIEDLLFWLVATVLIFYYLLHRNAGEIRPFMLVGMATGAVLYFATVSRWVVHITVTVVKFVEKVIRAMVRIILLPLRLAWVFAAPHVKKATDKSSQYLRRVRRYGRIRWHKIRRNRQIIRKKV